MARDSLRLASHQIQGCGIADGASGGMPVSRRRERTPAAQQDTKPHCKGHVCVLYRDTLTTEHAHGYLQRHLLYSGVPRIGGVVVNQLPDDLAGRPRTSSRRPALGWAAALGATSRAVPAVTAIQTAAATATATATATASPVPATVNVATNDTAAPEMAFKCAVPLVDYDVTVAATSSAPGAKEPRGLWLAHATIAALGVIEWCSHAANRVAYKRRNGDNWLWGLE